MNAALLIATLLAAETPIADAAALPGATYRVVHEDAVVRVLAHKLEPGGADLLHQHPCTINYALGPFTVEHTSASGYAATTSRAFRSAWTRPAEAHSARNAGTQPVRHLTIELKAPMPGMRGCGPAASGPVAAPAADHATRVAQAFHKVVLDNAALRVIEANVPAGQSTPPHALGCGVTIALTQQALRRIASDGATTEVEHAPSTAWWRPAATGAVANRGAHNAFSLLIEFKHAPPGAAGCAAPVAP